MKSTSTPASSTPTRAATPCLCVPSRLGIIHDAHQPGRAFNASANRCERVSVDSDSYYCVLDVLDGLRRGHGKFHPTPITKTTPFKAAPFSTPAAPPRASITRTHSASTSSDASSKRAQWALRCPMAGVSFSLAAPSRPNAATWTSAEAIHHPCTIVGTLAESNSAFLRATGVEHFTLRAFGYDKKGGPLQGLLIDVAGTETAAQHARMRLDPGFSTDAAHEVCRGKPGVSGRPGQLGQLRRLRFGCDWVHARPLWARRRQVALDCVARWSLARDADE